MLWRSSGRLLGSRPVVETFAVATTEKNAKRKALGRAPSLLFGCCDRGCGLIGNEHRAIKNDFHLSVLRQNHIATVTG